jgi:hypothetical protein
MSDMKSALAAQIQKIGADLQSGVIPSTTQNIIHLMDLKSKLDKAKALESSQAAQQLHKPTVKDQIVGSAVQEAHQASVEDMMRERARMMQDEVGQTGGISDFLPKHTEEAYAKGGPIAFAARGLVPGETMAEQLERLLAEQKAPDAYVGASERVAPKTQSIQAPLAATELPQGFRNMASRIAAGIQAPRASFDFANPNQAAQAPAQSQGLAALYDEAIGQNPITTAEQARQQREAYLGPNTGIASLREDIGKMKSEAAEDKERAPGMALMKAGLATMAGTSPLALTNIAKGIQEGDADYRAAQKDYRQAQEKQLELNAKLDAAERQEKIDAYKFGEDSEKASRSANTALKIAKATAENKAELDRAELDLKKESNSIMRQHYADLNDKYDTAASGAASGLRGDINNKNELKALDQSLDSDLKDLREQYKTGTLIGQDIRQDERYIDIMNKKNAVQQKLAALAGIGKEIQTAPPPAKDYSLADKLSGYGR